MPSRTRRFRGGRTHGRGHKAGRGKGKRGGFGNAGMHKHKFKWMIKYDPDHFGRHGFKRPQLIVGTDRTINLEEVEANLGKYLLSGAAKHVEGKIQVDLGPLGFDKLLGSGRATLPLTITVPKASSRAVEKMKKAGGVVVAEEVTSDEDKKKARAARAAPVAAKAAPAKGATPQKGGADGKAAPPKGAAPKSAGKPAEKAAAPTKPAGERPKAPPTKAEEPKKQ
jgi:large subunit ribosomal protein L15